jgi:hypothetical protein
MNALIEGSAINTSGALTTLFYSVFMRRSNLSFQPFDIQFDTQSRTGDFIYGTIPNRAQRIVNMFLRIDNPRQLETFDILMNGVTVYSFTGEYIYLHNQLRKPQSKRRIPVLIIPIMKYIPILENTTVRLKISSPTVRVQDIKLTIDCCFDKLPNDGDYIINQVQTFFGDPQKPVITNFYNVVKELIFCIQNEGDSSLVYNDVVSRMKFEMNGVEKFNNSGMYFRYIQPMEYHTNAPGPYVYSFCIDPENELPTGGVNMSMIKNQVFNFSLLPGPRKTVRIYAQSYNILRVRNNKGKMLFNNI